MNKTIQIRNVPAALHQRLRTRAAAEGVSMSHFALREIKRALDRPSRQELLEAIRSQPEVEPDLSPADLLREERDRR